MIGNTEECLHFIFNADKNKIYEIKEYKRKRTLNANAYAWQLIGQIADVLRSSKDEVYLLMLKRYGQSQLISVLEDADITDYVKYFDVVGNSMLNGKKFIHYRIYKGSSQYDTREMAILIDGIVSEAKELEIETLPPAEVERLKSMWRE